MMRVTETPRQMLPGVHTWKTGTLWSCSPLDPVLRMVLGIQEMLNKFILNKYM